MSERSTRRLAAALSGLLIVFTVLFLGFFLAGVARGGPVESFEQLLDSLGHQRSLYTLAYVNVTLLTVAATAWMACLYVLCREVSPAWAVVGVMFVPVYCAFNLFAYFSQITIVPALLELRLDPDYRTAAEALLCQMVQMIPTSGVGVFNGMAYALLGIPSMIFAALLWRRYSERGLRLGAALLGLNGAACILGVPGTLLGIPILANGSMIGAICFLLALFPLGWFLWREN